MNETERTKLLEIRAKVKQSCSKYMIENTLGITIKKSKSSGNKKIDEFNIYDKKTGELLMVNVSQLDIDHLSEWIGRSLFDSLIKEAELDEDSENVNNLAEEQRTSQKEYEKKYYKTCPICGMQYDSSFQSHSHWC